MDITNITFLTDYFILQITLSEINYDTRSLFDTLSDIYKIPSSEQKKLFNLTENKDVKEMIFKEEYFRYQRSIKFQESNKTSIFNFTPEEWSILKIKGSALVLMSEQELYNKSIVNSYLNYNVLLNKVNEGNIYALRIMGYLYLCGLLVKKDFAYAKKLFNKAAQWNDINSLLALIYMGEKTEYNLDRIYEISKNILYSKFYDLFDPNHIRKINTIEETKLIHQGIQIGTIKQDIYNEKFARIIYSTILDTKTKAKIICKEETEFIDLINELPLKLNLTDNYKFNLFQDLLINREDDIKEINLLLKNTNLKKISNYKPICLYSNSHYLLNFYLQNLIKNNPDFNFIKIDIANLNKLDIDYSPSNIFLRNLQENKFNIYLLNFSNASNLNDEILDFIANILDSKTRAEYRLISPNLILNLSNTLPICYSNEKWDILKKYCDIFYIKDLSVSEKYVALHDILENKKSLYHISNISIHPSLVKKFTKMNIDDVDKIIDDIILHYKEEDKEIIIDEAMYNKIYDNDEAISYGFGGK